MRLLFIICESGIEGRVMDMLGRIGAPGYTRFTGAIGNGKHGPREGTPVWPGLNSLILTCVPDEMGPEVLEGLEQIQAERSGRMAIKVFSVPSEEYS